MYIKRTAWLLASLVAASLLFFNITKTQAQESGLALSVSPLTFEIDANPGDVLERSIRLTNNAETPQGVTVETRNFTAAGEEGGVDLTQDDTTYSLAKWVSVDKPSSTLAGRTSEVFTFTISVPANAEPGGHFGAVLFKTDLPENSDEQTGAVVGTEIGPLLLVRIAGDINEDASLASFKAEKEFYEKGPVTFETRVRNDGNVHVAPRGMITVKNMFGKTVAELPLDEQNVLPAAVRRTLATWEPGFAVGRYTATLNAVAGDSNISITGETTVTIFPYKVLVPVLLAVIALIVLLIHVRKRFAKAFKALKENEAKEEAKPTTEKPHQETPPTVSNDETNHDDQNKSQ